MKREEWFDKYYPVDAGFRWTLVSEELGTKTFIRCTRVDEISPQNFEATFHDEFEIDAESAGNRTYRIRNGQVFDIVDGKDVGPILRLPMTDGERWTFEDPNQGELSIAVHKEDGPVETAMGPFEDCYRVEWMSEEQQMITVIEWYAPEVGLVKYSEFYVTGVDTYSLKSHKLERQD